MTPAVSKLLLKLLGWRLLEPARRPDKAVVIAYPHTSNWDFLFTMLGKASLGQGAHWVAKDSLFRWPLGGPMRWMGGIAVNRRERTGFVDQMARQFAARDRFLLAMAPEGTRSLTPGWKTGFYRIALAANVPVALGCVDYARREVGVLAYLELSGDEAADIARIAEIYAGRRGLRPELASPIRWLD
jgi:1-acyl-sn-glycerol-3-phosphate acyltransferase